MLKKNPNYGLWQSDKMLEAVERYVFTESVYIKFLQRFPIFEILREKHW